MKYFRSRIKKVIESRIIGNRTMSRFFRYAMADQGILFFREFNDHELLYYPHDIIGLILTEQGEYQRDSVRFIAEFFRKHAYSLHESWILELGGNIGTHSIYFCKEFENVKVLTVEADPENISVLQRNVDLNNLDDQVAIVGGAVSNYDGTIELVRNYFNRGGTSVSGDKSMHRGSVFSTESMRVDSLLCMREIDPAKIGLVWIDVEGHELEVFEGMENLVSKSKPPVFFEYTPGETSRNSRLLDLVFEHYNSVWISGSGGFDKISRDQLSLIAESVDVFAVCDQMYTP